MSAPIVERLRRDFDGQPFDTAICRDVQKAADTIEDLVALLTDTLDYVPPFIELSERGHAYLAKIGGSQ